MRRAVSLRYGTDHPRSCCVWGVEQRASPIFGRAAITLGIDPHSSLCVCKNVLPAYSSAKNYKNQTSFFQSYDQKYAATFFMKQCRQQVN